MFPTHTLRDPKRDLLIVKAIHVAGVFTLEERGVGQQVRRTFLLTSMTPQQRWWHEHATWTKTWVLTWNCMPWYPTSRSGTHEQCLFSVWRTITPPSFTSTQPQMMTYTAATTKLKNSTMASTPDVICHHLWQWRLHTRPKQKTRQMERLQNHNKGCQIDHLNFIRDLKTYLNRSVSQLWKLASMGGWQTCLALHNKPSKAGLFDEIALLNIWKRWAFADHTCSHSAGFAVPVR